MRSIFPRLAVVLAFVAPVPGARAESAWRVAEPGWKYEFPRDHLPHPQFKTEWWYFTGNLRDSAGRSFGYQLTFFRQGLRPGDAAAVQSRFVVSDLKFAHFALTDVKSDRFHFSQKLSRGAFGEAGFGEFREGRATSAIAWIDEWALGFAPGSDPSAAAPHFKIQAQEGAVQLALALEAGKPWAIHGHDGISQKADGPGRASHYYSGTRMPTRGQVTVEGRVFEVTGETWFDHEWATNQLTADQAGWDWFSLQFADGTELMLYQLRRRAGGNDPNSSGSFIDREGKVTHLTRDAYTLRPVSEWRSPKTGARYPLEWEVRVPSLDLTARVRTPVQAQELVLLPIAYWEGLIEVSGRRAGAELRGHGYMELTGYAGALVGLSEPVE